MFRYLFYDLIHGQLIFKELLMFGSLLHKLYAIQNLNQNIKLRPEGRNLDARVGLLSS